MSTPKLSPSSMLLMPHQNQTKMLTTTSSRLPQRRQRVLLRSRYPQRNRTGTSRKPLQLLKSVTNLRRNRTPNLQQNHLKNPSYQQRNQLIAQHNLPQRRSWQNLSPRLRAGRRAQLPLLQAHSLATIRPRLLNITSRARSTKTRNQHPVLVGYGESSA